MYPLTNFQQLVGLCQDEPTCKSIFSKYKLIAIILQSETESKLGSNLSQAFDRLHETTGKYFAVISFVKPSRQWVKSHREWIEMQDNIMNNANCDEQDFIEDLQRRLNITSLPAMILTESLLSNKYVVAKPYSKQIVEQLENISRFVNEHDDMFSIDSKRFLDSITTGKDTPCSLSTENGESLANNIVDLMALRVLNREPGLDSSIFAGQKQTALSWIKNTLAKLKVAFENLAKNKDSSFEEIDAARERLSDYKSAILKVKENTQSGSLYYIPFNVSFNEAEALDDSSSKYKDYRLPYDSLKYFEKESCRQAVKYNSFLKAKIWDRDDDYYKSEYKDLEWMDNDYCSLVDYAEEGACLGKIIEEEVNASIVQLIRRDEFGMEMPAFYRIFNSSMDKCEVATKGRKVAFNFFDNHRNCLRSIPVGDVNASIGVLVRKSQQIANSLGVFSCSDYILQTSTFARYRGYSAHPNPMPRDDFESMLVQFKRIVSSYMEDVAKLKSSLRR